MEFFDMGLKPIRLGLAINNDQIEKWFEKELESRAEIVKIEEQEPQLDTNGLIILRKNRNGGIKDPVSLVKKYVKVNPRGLILFIAGLMDDEGTEIFKQLEKLAYRVSIVSSPHGRMSEKDIRKGISELLEEWEVCNTNVYYLFGSKGGCGTTTISAYLANYLSEKGSVAIVESRGAFKYHNLNENIEVLEKKILTSEELRELQKTHHFVLLDSIAPEEVKKTHLKKILVMDCSPESIGKAKNISTEHVVLNNFCSNILPKEIIEKEIGKKATLIIENDREKFLKAAATGEILIKNIDKLI